MHRTALLLRDLLSDYPESNGVGGEIVACEHEGDRIAHDILHRAAEHTSRRAAPEPADVHALAGALDDIVDFSEEAADQLGALRRRGADGGRPADRRACSWRREEIVEALRGLTEGRRRRPAPRGDPPARERGRPDRPRGGRRRCSRTGSTRWS